MIIGDIKIKIKNMKKIFLTVMLLFVVCLFVQDKKNKKLQVGLSYSLSGKKAFHNSPFSFYGNYQMKTWDKFSIDAGLRIFYASSIESNNFTTKWAFNPNVTGSYSFVEKLNGYVAFGYYYDSYKFTPTYFDNFVPDRNIVTQGITISPGLKYL